MLGGAAEHILDWIGKSTQNVGLKISLLKCRIIFLGTTFCGNHIELAIGIMEIIKNFVGLKHFI